MRYKKGDKVRVRSLEWHNANKDEDGDVPLRHTCGSKYNFVADMSCFCGKIVTINNVGHGRYDIKEDDCCFYWTDEMFDGLADETESQEKMVSLGKVEEWLYKNFYESYNLNNYGEYDLDKPYIASFFNTINEMFDDFRKTMEE